MTNKTYFERLVIAAYRLPFKFSKTKTGYRAEQNSGGLVSAILSLSENFQNKNNLSINNKIVWAGIADDFPANGSSEAIDNPYFKLVPIHIPEKLNDLYYNGFCNDLIWPLFHYFPSFCNFNSNYFYAYQEANSRFCDEIAEMIRPGDFIWIHDYQLLLLPEMIRKRVPDATIGFFLHIPFPSFEIFRLLPRQWRESIIYGMLGADLIGFHTHDYAQYFIKSVKRTTGYECNQNYIYSPNKLVKADAFPIGIDFEKFNTAFLKKEVFAEKQKIKRILLGQKLIFSVDRLDYTKGLLLRLKGYENFLENFPEWHSRVVFNMVVVPSRDKISKYKEMKRELEYTIGRINGRFSTLDWRPIIYQYKSLSFNELVARYDLSDVGLITPLRDGMNLVAKEYIASQNDNIGVLILSEMAGAAAELNEAIIINPADEDEMAQSIYSALEMSLADKSIRLERMQSRILSYNVFTWAFDFFNQTFEAKKQQNLRKIRFINPNILLQIVSDYQNALNRILFLDYDGTLVPFNKYPEKAMIDQTTLELIEKLSDETKNQVVIISGRDKEFLDQQFKNVNVTLVAEHGYFIKKAGQKWDARIEMDELWKDSILPILVQYVNRCNGTFIEEKTGSLAWHYRNVDAEFAQLRLHELKDDLSEIIRAKTNFEILEGNKVLEIRCGRFDKGMAASELIGNNSYDFIIAAGDDQTDEILFKALPGYACTIRIGSHTTIAKYNIADNAKLISLLNALVNPV